MLVLNKTRARTALGCGAALLASACAAGTSTTPRSRVAQDMGCTTEGTTVQEIGPIPGQSSARWQVTGCGRTAVYVCTTPVRDCWREGDVRPGAPPAAPPPPPPAPPPPPPAGP